MVYIEKYRRICELISKQLVYGLQGEEERELQQWLEESAENRELYGRITAPDYLHAQEVKRNSIDVRGHRAEIERILGVRPGRRFWRRCGKYAALALLLLSIGIAVLSRRESADVRVQTESIQPGKSKAFLILSDGKTVVLGDGGEEKGALHCDGSVATASSGVLTYVPDSIGTGVGCHTLVVPKGGEYVMKLADGTVVYLNSESRLEYPVRFSGGSREVCLEGEAYFKVAYRKQLPFIVKTRHMDVNVSGTEFNVRAYADENRVQTTLVQGKVSVFTGSDRRLSHALQPDEQAELDLEKGKVEVKQVDVAPFIAWKNGQFLFRGERLDEIMTVLKRWYDFEVVYREEWMKEMEFAGKLNRSDSFEPILDVIRSTHKLSVDVKGKTIVFSTIN